MRSGVGLVLDGHQADHPAGHDPPDGPEDPDGRELLLRARHLVEGDGVHQGQGGVVAEGVGQQHPEEGGRVGDRRDAVEERRPGQVHDAEDLLRGEEAVGDHADEEGRHDGPPGHGAVGLGGLGPRELEALEQVGPHGDPPGPPDEELEEHHRGQAGANRSGQGVLGIHGRPSPFASPGAEDPCRRRGLDGPEATTPRLLGGTGGRWTGRVTGAGRGVHSAPTRRHTMTSCSRRFGALALTLGLVALLAPGAAIGGENPPPGFTSLFNGKDLTGWKVPEGDGGHWKVVDGVIDYDAQSEAEGDKSLYSEKEYGDYVLRADWRIKDTPWVNPQAKIVLPERRQQEGTRRQGDRHRGARLGLRDLHARPAQGPGEHLVLAGGLGRGLRLPHGPGAARGGAGRCRPHDATPTRTSASGTPSRSR